MDHSDTNDAHSINEEDTTTSGSSSQLNVTMKRRSFSHDYYGSCARSGASDVNDDGDSEVRLTSSAQLHPLSHEHGDNNSIQPTQMENSTLSRQQRQKQRQSKSSSVSERRRCRTQGDVLLMGADDTINRERANTCPQHQFHHDLDERDEDEDLLSVIYSGEDEEAGGVGRDDETHRLHGSGSNERRTQSLPSSSTLLSPERQSISSYTPSAAPSSPRRRAASASSIISSLQQQTSTATLLHTSSTTTTSSISSYTSTTIKHTLLKILMLISIYQLLSYTYNTGLSPDVKYQLGEINYDIEEYWNGGRLWSLSSSGSSNRLSASRIVGSSGISFNDDFDVGEDVEEGVVGFISSILSEKFGNQYEGGEEIVDVEGEEHNVEVVAFANGVGNQEGEVGGTNVSSSSRLDSTTVKKKSEETTATPIIVANSNNITKRRPAMAHVISISENRHPVYLPRASSSSRRMKSNEVHWTFSRIAGAIIWIGLMIPILEVGIREVSRRYRLGSLLRRRLRGGFRRRSPENVHIL